MHHLLPAPLLEERTALPAVGRQSRLSVCKAVSEVSSPAWNIQPKPSLEKGYGHS